ncbi:MAG TPA: threonine synthase [bacterium]|nr:threonine synthase [bacterium]HQG45483.1 threonine synthase [bacterium]HQI50000.1 threonine synthase [bacterium]HQJ66148.1 threonine synthase [bacterium]
MNVTFEYQCCECGRRYTRDQVTYLCPVCSATYRPGMPLKGVLRAEFDYAAIRRTLNPHRVDYALWNAVEADYFPPCAVGNTPFTRIDRFGALAGFANVWAKNDGLNPSGSLKDRASVLVAAEARRTGAPTLVAASTGNAASSLAAVCAAAGLACIIFVPATAPRAKLVQMLIHGARVLPINGTYDDAFRLSLEYTAKYGGLNRNTAYHPLTIEGKKTAGLEIFRQNGGRAPEVILVPVGDGVILSGVHKAFYDLKASGLIEKIPRLIAVQAESSDALHRFIATGHYRNAEKPQTFADSISVAAPSNAVMARQAVLESEGFSLTVSDEEILSGQKKLAETTGIFAEPAAAAAAAGLLKLKGDTRLDPGSQIVLLVTGHGLKDPGAALGRLQLPPPIEPELGYVEKLLNDTIR